MENKLFEFIEKYILLTADEKNALNALNLFRTVKKGTVLLKEGQYSAITHRPYHTEMPESFKQLDDKYSKFFFGEPGLHFGVNF